MADQDEFLAHMTNDRGATPFIQTAFAGTRALTEFGRTAYELKTGKQYKPEPPPISHDAFIHQVESWIEAMGGKFRGDEECGCVPHHYKLSLEGKSAQATPYLHIEVSGHAEIPIHFEDDGSFVAEQEESLLQTGSVPTSQGNCTINGNLTAKIQIKGTLDDKSPVLHLHLSIDTPGGSVTTTCADGHTSTRSFPSIPNPSGTGTMDWDMKSVVGVDQDVPVPNQNASLTSSMKIRIIQTD